MIARLRARPGLFDFFQAVRVLEAHAREQAGGAGTARIVGHDHAPKDEVVRFLVLPSLAFAPSAVRELSGGDGAGPAKLVVSFLGLTGPTGVLPQHYTELVIRRMHARDPTLRDFLDLLHHRTVSAFYRAWRKYHFPFSWEQERLEGGRDDRFTASLYSLVGLGTDHLRGRQPVPDEVLLFHGGHFARATRSASGLEAVLTAHFGVRFRVEQFVGRWVEVPEEERARMPDARAPRDVRVQLGSLMLGDRFWDVQSKVRLCAGLLTHEQFTSLAPGSRGRRELGALARSYLGPGFDFDLELELLPGEAPDVHLGAPSLAPFALGRNGWLQSRSAVPAGACKTLFSLDTD